MSDRGGESEAERRGQKRADAAHERLENARERARRARQDAAAAVTPESAESHRREAKVHDRAARLQGEAEKLQRTHIEEAREGQFDKLGEADPSAKEKRDVADEKRP
jgi:hypothetical protein